MAKIGEILKSGALGLGPALVARNPKMLQGFGVAGNLAYKSLKDKEEDKEKEAAKPAMKKGGSVKSSASKRADGIAQRGKTRGKIV